MLPANDNKQKKMKMLSPKLWTLGGVLQLLAAGLWIPQAWMLATAIYAMMTGEAVMETAINAAIFFIALGGVRIILSAAGIRISYRQARDMLTQVRHQTLNALRMRSPLDIGAPTSGTAASVLTEQAESVVPYLSRFQPAKLKVMIMPWVIGAAVFYHSWLAACILFIAAPLIPVFMALIGYGAQKASEKQMLEIGQMNGFLLDRLRGLATIRMFDGVDMVAQRLRETSEQVREKTMVVLSIAFLSSAVMELFSALGVAMVAVYIGFHLLGVEDMQFGVWAGSMTLEQGMFILLLAPTFFDPLKELSAVWHDRAAGVTAIKALNDLGEQGVALVGRVDEGQTHSDLEIGTGALSICMEQVCFAYPGASQKVLNNFSLQVPAGAKVALVAPSGYGKSTILALLAGLLPVDSGNIQLSDVELNDHHADILRMRMGWISQHPHIFSGTLLGNITLGRKGISKKEVENAIDIAALSGVAQGQLERRLGEGAGAGLSGGEILRLTIARAMASPNLGLLLADEPTAHLDSETAQEVIDGMMTLAAKGVTLVVATHDERLLPYMTHVIRLDQVIAEGEA